MRIHRWTRGWRLDSACGLIIGNFDGVHRGHQAMIARLREVCAARGWRAAAMSFYPHPRAVVEAAAPPLLSTLHDRAYWLAHYGIEDWLLLPFTRRLRETSAQDFLRRYLQGGVAPGYLLVGDDFRFGYRGRGDMALLQTFAAGQGMVLESVDTVSEGGQRISSSAVRRALAEHDLASARALLGHELTFSGRVRPGEGRGRQLEARTANIHVPGHWCLPDGVYVVQMRLCQGQGQAQAPYWGVANLGGAPTFAASRRKLEVHLLDAAPDLYGRSVQTAFRHYLRPVHKFADAAALQQQIREDIHAAQAFIAAQTQEKQVNG